MYFVSTIRFRHLDTMGDANDQKLCFLDHFVDGIEANSWHIQRGERLLPIWPKDARIFVSPERPGIKLSSLIGNVQSMLIASRAFKKAIEKHCRNVDIEYLPFTLYDHRKRVHSRDYFIINPIGTYDCLDLEKSDITWSKNDPEKIVRIREYVIDRDKMKNAPQLFRIDKDPAEYVLGRALAREMYDEDLTNIFWTELAFGDEKK